MVIPILVYSSEPYETAEHFHSVAGGTGLPMVICNGPPIHQNDVTPGTLAFPADCEDIVCFRDGSDDIYRFIDTRSQVSKRLVLFASPDSVVLESIAVGAQGWISEMSNTFPEEGEVIFRLAGIGHLAEAMSIYEWLISILHLGARPDLV